MWFAGCEFITDLHDADSAFGLRDIVLTLLRSVVREHILKLLRSDEEDILRECQVNVIILDRHILFCLAEAFVYSANRFL